MGDRSVGLASIAHRFVYVVQSHYLFAKGLRAPPPCQESSMHNQPSEVLEDVSQLFYFFRPGQCFNALSACAAMNSSHLGSFLSSSSSLTTPLWSCCCSSFCLVGLRLVAQRPHQMPLELLQKRASKVKNTDLDTIYCAEVPTTTSTTMRTLKHPWKAESGGCLIACFDGDVFSVHSSQLCRTISVCSSSSPISRRTALR